MPLIRPQIQFINEYGVRDGTSQRGTLGIGEVSLQRKVLVSWSDTGKCAQHFLGYSRVFGNRLERLLPASHPDDPSLIPHKITIENGFKFLSGRGANPDIPGGPLNKLADQSVQAVYNKACLTVDYIRAPYKLLEDADTPSDQEYIRYTVVEDPQGGGDSITLPGYTLRYIKADNMGPVPGGGPLPVGFNVPMPLASSRITMRWCRLPANFIDWWNPGPWLQRAVGDPLASPSVYPYVGSANKYPLGAFPAGTLRFLTWEVKRKEAPIIVLADTPTGLTWESPAMEQDLVLNFLYLPQTHYQLFWSDTLAVGSTRTDAGNSGWYFIGRGTTLYNPTTVPDNYSLAHARDLRHLWRVDEV